MAMEVPEGIILIWPGPDAGIPADWVRVTDLDSKFPKATAAGVDPNVTGGSDTHTHTSPAHSHTPNAHRHYGQTSTYGGVGENDGGPNNDASRDSHYHNFDFTNISGGILSDAITYASGDSKPPYHDVIFIEPDGAPQEPPDGVIALYDRSSLPTDWDICDGNNGTPNLNNKYLRGAATGLDAGTTGGSLNHTHSVNHTHSSVNHYHVGLSQYDPDANLQRNSSSGGGAIAPSHRHQISLNNVGETGSAYTATAGSADTVEPLHKKLIAIQNNTGAGDKPRYMIGLWLGLLANIPAGWVLLDGTNGTIDMRGYHLKITSNTVEIGNTGGSNTHTHAPSNSHTHTAAGTHTHTGSADTYVVSGSTGAGGNNGAQSHNHTVASCSYDTTTWNNATIQANSSNGEPAYRTVAFIQFTGVDDASERPAETTGQEAASNERFAELYGVNPAGERFAETLGKDRHYGERAAEVSGMIQWIIEEKQDLGAFTE